MFKRALKLFHRSPAPPEESDDDDGEIGNTPLPISHAPATADETDLKNPLIPATNGAPEVSGGFSSAGKVPGGSVFKRALKLFHRSPAPPEADCEGEIGNTPPPISRAPTTAAENDLENPLIPATNGDPEVSGCFSAAGDVSGGGMFKRPLKFFHRSPPPLEVDGDGEIGNTPPPISHAPTTTVAETDLENPLIPATNGGPEVSGAFAAGKVFKHPRCGCLMLALVFVALFGVAIFSFVDNVNRVYDNPRFELDSVVISSFNVSKASPESRWEIELALDSVEGSFKELDLRYEAPRLWVYSGDKGGFVSMTSPSLEYSPDGRRLILHALFGVQEDLRHPGVVRVDVVVESNTVHKIKSTRSTEVVIKSFVMINCEDLKIEFGRLNKRFGSLIESGKSCRVQVCPIESHPLYDGVDECTTSS